MDITGTATHYDTIVIGGGQAGLSVGYHLRRRGRPFVILEAADRVGHAWRSRWDSLRLFTPARYSGLDGMPFPGDRFAFPTKDEMADYLEAYAARFDLPIRTGTRVTRLRRSGDGEREHYGGPRVERGSERDSERPRFHVETTAGEFTADHVVVAMADFQRSRVPGFAGDVDPDIVQIHSKDYRNPDQLQEGDVLVVGAGNSGAEIAIDLAPRHRVLLSGRDVGHMPFRIAGFLGRHLLVPLVLRVVFHRVLSVTNPLGRRARPKFLSQSGPLVRTRPRELAAAGVERVARTVGAREGRPVLEDGRALDVRNVVWCTGFHTGFPEWIDLPVLDGEYPVQESGLVPDQPGLYFVGLLYLHSVSSEMIHGVGRDAERVVRAIDGAARARQPGARGAREDVRRVAS